MKYALVTSARNEAKFIEGTIRSVIGQTVLPMRWVIVDDGSTDRTSEIVRSYLKSYPWIELLQRQNRPDRSFTGKALAVNAAVEGGERMGASVSGRTDIRGYWRWVTYFIWNDRWCIYVGRSRETLRRLST